MTFDVANAVKLGEDKLEVRTEAPAIAPTFAMRFTVKQLKELKQHHLDKAGEMQALIDKAALEGVKE